MADDIRGRIEAGNKAFGDAFRRRDSAAMANLYTAEAQLLPAGSDFVRGTAAIRAKLHRDIWTTSQAPR